MREGKDFLGFARFFYDGEVVCCGRWVGLGVFSFYYIIDKTVEGRGLSGRAHLGDLSISCRQVCGVCRLYWVDIR